MKSMTSSSTSRTKSSLDSPPKRTLTLKTSPRKQTQSLHSAELKQLESFVKTRSQQLDDEIISMRSKLKTSKASTLGLTNNLDELAEDELFKTLSRGHSKENDDIKELQHMGNLNIQGKKLNRIDAMTSGLQSAASKQPTKLTVKQQMEEDEFLINFLNKNPFEESERLSAKDLSQSETKKRAQSSREDEGEEDDDGFSSPQPVFGASFSINDRLIQLLATFKQKMEDSGFSLREFYSLLSSAANSSSSRKYQTSSNVPLEWVHINEFTEVLQTDLLFPLTKQDQQILLQEFGSSTVDSTNKKPDLMLHLSSLLQAAGFTLPNTNATNKKNKRLDESEGNDEDVEDARLQQLIEENKALKAAQQAAASSKEKNNMTKQIAQLTSDNSKYQQELSSLNTEFFEELENLKHRYSMLEQVVGEDPYHHPIPELSLDDQRFKQPIEGGISMRELNGKELATVKEEDEHELTGSQKIPLARLAWASKQSMHAMDRADYGSDLVRGPKVRRPLTAAHESWNTLPQSSTKGRSARLGGVEESVSEEEYLSRSMKATLIPSNAASDPHEKEFRVGGLHGIGSGTYARTSATATSSSSFSNLCERRLAFELSSCAKPSQTITTFIHKIREMGRSNKLVELKALQSRHAKEEKDSKDAKTKEKEIETLLSDATPSYLTVPQLASLCRELSLQLTPPEIDILASGFGSNGKGGINCQELIDMIQSLVYNLIGSHALEMSQPLGETRQTAAKASSSSMFASWDQTTSSHQAAMTTGSSKTSSSKKKFNAEFKRLIYETVENMIQYDKRGQLTTTTSIHQTLLKPFLEYDTEETGMIPFQFFMSILQDAGVLFSKYEYKLLAKPYVLYEAIPLPHHLTASMTSQAKKTASGGGGMNVLPPAVETFRNERLLAHLRGQLQVQQQPVLRDFLAQHSLSVPRSGGQSSTQPTPELDELDVDGWIQGNTMLLYPIFVQDLTDVFEHYMASHEGLITTLHPKLSWTLEEFHFIDHLLVQLESMPADKRRKTLISLQYALENADMNEEGELDGFAILSSLINSGFQLQRYHRVTLLKAAEAYGGKLDYLHLILTLLQTAITWYQSEYHLIYKILSAMGVTIEERRDWLLQCKRMLYSKSKEMAMKLHIKQMTSRLVTSQQEATLSATADTPADDFSRLSETADTYISPGMFLSILTQLRVHLTPEEEARLLDCLDTEQLAAQNIQKLHTKYLSYHVDPTGTTGQIHDGRDQREYRKQRLWNESKLNRGQTKQKGKAWYASLREEMDTLREEEEWEDEETEERMEMGTERDYDRNRVSSRLDALGLTKGGHTKASFIGNTNKKYRTPDSQQQSAFDVSPFQTPMINYQSFLSFLSRHVGNWIYHNFPLYTQLLQSIEAYSLNPLQDLYEFLTLCTSFDESHCSYIHIQHFVVVCYRSALFSSFPKSFVQELSNCLVQDSDIPNYINYKTFCLQLRGICSSIRADGGKKGSARFSKGENTSGLEVTNQGSGRYSASRQGDHSLPTNLLAQLVENSTDPQGRLSYLRNYLLLHCQYVEYHILTIKEFHSLLREFQIMYQYHELELLYLEIGHEVDLSLPTKLPISKTGDRNRQGTIGTEQDGKLQIIHMKSLMSLLMKHRISWVYGNPVLVKKLLTYMKDILMNGSNNGSTKTETNKSINEKGGGFDIILEEGKLSALIQHIISRIQAFTLQTYPLPTTKSSNASKTLTDGSSNPEGVEDTGLIENYIFEYILKSMQIYLSKEDLLYLADYSDPLPEATRINPYLLYDLLSCPFLASNSSTPPPVSTPHGGVSGPKTGSNVVDLMTPLLQQHLSANNNNPSSEGLPMVSYDTLSEAAIYALNHLHSLCWTVGKKHLPARTAIQWIADVTCIFEGFDRTGQGYISLEEFLLALKLLNISISWDILMNIPYVGYSPASPYAQPPSVTAFDPTSSSSMSGKSPSLRQGNSLVQYKKVLAYILQKQPPFGKRSGGSKKLDPEDYEHLYGDEGTEAEESLVSDDVQQSPTRKSTTKSKTFTTTTSSVVSKPSPTISQFFHILRKQLSIFILSQSSLEEVWYTMTQVFQQYDLQHTGYVTPRQFCLALGIILGEEEIMFTAIEWQEILEYFLTLSRKIAQQKHDSTRKASSAAYQPDWKSSSQGSTSRFLTGTQSGKLPNGSDTASFLQQGTFQEDEFNGQINYLLMIEMLFEPKEMAKKLQEVKTLASTTRGGINGLSSNALFNTKSYHEATAEKELSPEEKDRASRYLSKSSSSGRLRTAHETKNNNAHLSSSTKRNTLSASKRSQQTATSGNKSNDPITKRFQEANNKYTTLLRHGKEYGSSSGTSNSSSYRDEEIDQRSKRNPMVMTTTIHFPSASASSASSSRKNATSSNARSLSSSRVRFNATA